MSNRFLYNEVHGVPTWSDNYVDLIDGEGTMGLDVDEDFGAGEAPCDADEEQDDDGEI